MIHHVKILVVDDDEDDHVFFRDALDGITALEFETVSVYDGQEMLDYFLGTGPFESPPEVMPHLIVLDITMPKMDGFTALAELKKLSALPQIPVFVVSGTIKEEHYDTCRKLGCAGIYVKPIKITDLQEIFREMVEVAEGQV